VKAERAAEQFVGQQQVRMFAAVDLAAVMKP